MKNNEEYLQRITKQLAQMSFVLGFTHSTLKSIEKNLSCVDCHLEKIKKLTVFLEEHIDELVYKNK